jgi:hypothetical protein
MKNNKKQSIVNNMLDPNFLERILNSKIPNQVLKKFNEKEHREEIGELIDLKDLKTKSEAEIYKALNSMLLNKQ